MVSLNDSGEFENFVANRQGVSIILWYTGCATRGFHSKSSVSAIGALYLSGCVVRGSALVSRLVSPCMADDN